MRNLRFPGMIAAALLVFSACNDGGPASPTEPRLTEPTNELTGEWHGTISYAGNSCASEDVATTAVPWGTRVRLNVRSLCYGNIVFLLDEPTPAVSGSADVTYSGSCQSFFGSINRPALKGEVTGTINGEALHLETTSFSLSIVSCSRPGVTLDLVR